MNEQRISTNQLKILLALQHISEDAQQLKENEKTDVNDNTNVDKQWNNWTGFKTRFLNKLGRVRFTRKHVFRITQIKQAEIHNWEETIIHNQVYRTIQRIDQESWHHGRKCHLSVQSRPYHRQIQEYRLN
jgi:hypothetical protein